MKKVFSFFIFIFSFLYVFAQDTAQYYNNNFLRYEDYVYKKNIRSVQCTKADYEFSPPVIALGSGDKIKLSFDDLDGDSKNYRFTIIHCDENWQPTTRLLQSEYINGFYDDNISDYQYSNNTLQRYVHYELIFPTENLKPTKSGNYILKVFLDYDQNNVVLTRRFMVLDKRVQVIPFVHNATIIQDYDYKQEVDFTIQTNGYQIANPFQDLKVVLMQNDRTDNAITTLKPLFVTDDSLTYDYDHGNVFPGGSEFRSFDISSITDRTERIKDVVFDPDSSKSYQVYLLPDKPRNFLRYVSDVDEDGKYKINHTGSSGDAVGTDAEYVYVHFALSMSEPVNDGSIYVFGGLTNWKYSNEYKMKYNYTTKEYEATLYLKQGYYDYEYTFLKDGDKFGDETFIEGSHVETENGYCIYVYYKPFTSNYNMLIGMKRFNSVKH